MKGARKCWPCHMAMIAGICIGVVNRRRLDRAAASSGHDQPQIRAPPPMPAADTNAGDATIRLSSGIGPRF